MVKITLYIGNLLPVESNFQKIFNCKFKFLISFYFNIFVKFAHFIQWLSQFIVHLHKFPKYVKELWDWYVPKYYKTLYAICSISLYAHAEEGLKLKVLCLVTFRVCFNPMNNCYWLLPESSKTQYVLKMNVWCEQITPNKLHFYCTKSRYCIHTF